MRTFEEVKKAFTPVGKLDAVQNQKILKVQKAFIDLATDIVDLVPDSPDRTAALRKILNAKFECVQAITHPFVQPKTVSKPELPEGLTPSVPTENIANTQR